MIKGIKSYRRCNEWRKQITPAIGIVALIFLTLNFIYILHSFLSGYSSNDNHNNIAEKLYLVYSVAGVIVNILVLGEKGMKYIRL